MGNSYVIFLTHHPNSLVSSQLTIIWLFELRDISSRKNLDKTKAFSLGEL